MYVCTCITSLVVQEIFIAQCHIAKAATCIWKFLHFPIILLKLDFQILSSILLDMHNFHNVVKYFGHFVFDQL